jgi:predicted hydrocarbon binding protein
MTPIPGNGKTCSNLFARITLSSLNEVVGEHGMHVVFRMAGLPELVDTLPPQDYQKEIYHADLAAIFQTIGGIFGVHGARGIFMRAGQMTFNELRAHCCPAELANEINQPEVPVNEKVQDGLNALVQMLAQHTDQHFDLERSKGADTWQIVIHDCLEFQVRQAEEPVCAFTTVILEQALFVFSGGSKFRVAENHCAAAGVEACTFSIEVPAPENPPFKV